MNEKKLPCAKKPLLMSDLQTVFAKDIFIVHTDDKPNGFSCDIRKTKI